MADMLVYVSGDVSRGFRPGDVFVVQEDGEPWSHLERSKPGWLIVSVPGESKRNLSVFLSAEVDDTDCHQILGMRGFHLDLTALGSRTVISAEEAHGALKLRHPPTPDPDVLE